MSKFPRTFIRRACRGRRLRRKDVTPEKQGDTQTSSANGPRLCYQAFLEVLTRMAITSGGGWLSMQITTVTCSFVVCTLLRRQHVWRTADNDRDRHASGVDGEHEPRNNGAMRITQVENVNVDDSTTIMSKRATVSKRPLLIMDNNINLEKCSLKSFHVIFRSQRKVGGVRQLGMTYSTS